MDQEDFLSTLNDNLTLKPVDELKNERFISEVTSGKIKFLTVVESIQGILTNENVNIRERGVDFLSWVISQLPPDLFNSTEVVVIVNFYCNSLKGHHNILPPTFRGLLAIVKMKQIGKTEILQILVHLFQHVNCQTQLQVDRYNLFSILEFIVTNHLEDLREMGPDFVFGLISFIEGETDPTCLLLIFHCLPSFIRNFSLGHLTEEMFEVLFCYFPIDFNSSAKDDITFTRDDLAEGLIECLSASDSFSEQCLPMILEKLDSTLKTAKLDSYKLLQKCCKTLRVESLSKHLDELWKSIQKDVLPGNDKLICEFGLSALTEVLGLLSRDEHHKNILSSFLDDILATVKNLIKRVDENMIIQPGVKVLVAVSASSKIATSRILSFLKPFYDLESAKTLMEQKIDLSYLLPLLKSCHEHKISSSTDIEDLSNHLELISFYLNSMMSVDYDVRKLAFLGVSLVVSDLSLDLRKKLYEIIAENIKTKEDIKTSQELFKIWRQLAQDHDTEFHDILSNYFQLSPDQVEPYADQFLWALSLVADLPTFTGLIIPVFLTVITRSSRHVTGLESLLNACRIAKKNSSADFYHVIHAEHNILERLIFWWLESGEEIRSSNEGTIRSILSEIVALVMRNQYSYAQQFIVDKFIQILLKESTPLNGGGDFRSPVESLLKDSSIDVAQVVVILEAILGSIRPEVTIPLIFNLREKLASLALNSTQDSVRLSSSRLLASIVNKSKETLASDLLTKTSEDIFKHLEESSETCLKFNGAFLFTWLVKGVILKGGQSSEKWISVWFDLLGREDVGEVVAEGFRTVMEEDNLYLNLDSHNNLKVLYRQRLFGSFPKLLKMYESSEDSVKMNYLLGLVRLLQGVPSHLVKMEISNIAVLLVQCLNTDKPEVLLTSLQILVELLESRDMIFSYHIQSFVPSFLRLSRFEGHMKIRMSALKCLYFYGFYPTISLLPLKSQVIHDLESCLDDKKRLVRKEAVRARCRWFLVGAPGEDILDS